MTATLTIEEERGCYVGSPHPHNGYYAGDFSHRVQIPACRVSSVFESRLGLIGESHRFARASLPVPPSLASEGT